MVKDSELLSFEMNLVPKFSHSGAWVTISSIPPCDQCLEHTRGLSDYYKETHQCNFWKAEETSTHQEEDPTVLSSIPSFCLKP